MGGRYWGPTVKIPLIAGQMLAGPPPTHLALLVDQRSNPCDMAEHRGAAGLPPCSQGTNHPHEARPPPALARPPPATFLLGHFFLSFACAETGGEKQENSP